MSSIAEMIDEQMDLMVTKNRQYNLEAAGAFTFTSVNKATEVSRDSLNASCLITKKCKRQKPTCSEQEKRTVPEAIPNERENLHVFLFRVSDVLWNT